MHGSHVLLPTSVEAVEFAGARDDVLVGCGSVEYAGRARSTRGWEERIVIVKPDGSVLVHQKVGGEPVNWQPPDTRVRYWTETGDSTHLPVIYSYRFKPPEKMHVRFKTIDVISVHRLRDDQTPQITGAESNIADMIMRDPSLIEGGCA